MTKLQQFVNVLLSQNNQPKYLLGLLAYSKHKANENENPLALSIISIKTHTTGQAEYQC